MDDLKLDLLKVIVREAGRRILQSYRNPKGVTTKEDGSPVSDVDKSVSAYICSELGKAFPNHAIVSEESPEDGSRFNKEYCWFVDPLDNTRDYLGKRGNFGVLLGLTRNFKPILGVVYLPQEDELAYSVNGGGAFIESNGSEKMLIVDPSHNLKTVVSLSRKNAELDEMLRKVSPTEVYRKGGSVKILDVARGNANLFLCPTTLVMSLWDLCGLEAILEGAGGRITDVQGRRFDYSQRDTENPYGIVASNGIVHDPIIAKLR